MENISKEGNRMDGRTPEELRTTKMEVGVIKNADGSAYVEFGKNKVIASVYGPKECFPRHLQDPEKAIIQCKYNMMTFSVDDRKKPGYDRRSIEISKILSEAFESIVFTGLYPRASISVYIEIMEANAGTRCAGLVAGALALADAGIPMKGILSAVSVGKVNGEIVLDLNKEEDNYGQSDVPIGMDADSGEIVLFQMDGLMDKKEMYKAIDLGVEACKKINGLQKEALISKYSKYLPKEEV